MCGRFPQTVTPELLAQIFEVGGLLPNSRTFTISPRYNIAPSLPILAVRVEQSGPMAGKRIPVMLKWGLVPSWAKDPSSELII